MDKGVSVTVNKNLNMVHDKSAKCKTLNISLPKILVNDFGQFMKSGTKALNETEIEKKIGDIINIFKYIRDKDVY